MTPGVKSGANQIQASKSLLPEESQMTKLVKCCLPGKLIRDLSTWSFYWGLVNVATLCLAHTKIVDSQKESSINCIVYTVESNS